jgi:hypothetical protein
MTANDAISPQSLISRAPQVASRTIAGKSVLMKAPISSLNTLNKVGGFIWDALEQPKTIADLSRLIVEKFKVTAEQADVDILLFVKDLLHRELVIVKEETTK